MTVVASPSHSDSSACDGEARVGTKGAQGGGSARLLIDRFGLALGVVAGIGLAVRLLYVVHVAQDIGLFGDAQSYHLHGQQISAGAGYVRAPLYAATGESVASAWYPPGYPAVLAVLDGFGIDGVLGQKTAMAFLGSATVVLIGLIGRRLAGPVVGLAAGAVAALGPVLVVADGALGSETLYMLLVAAVVLQVYVMADEDEPTRLRWAALGASVALASYTRAEGVLLFAFLVVPLTIRWAWPWRRRVATAGLAAGAMVLVLAPWVARNYLTFDRFVPISTNGSALVGGANCDRTYYGDARGSFQPSCFNGIGVVEWETRAPTTEPKGRDFAAEARDRGLDFAAANASAVPSTAAVRVQRTWWMYDAREQLKLEAFFDSRDLAWLRWGYRFHLALLGLGFVGSVALARRRLRAWPLWSLLAMVSVTSALGYGNMRFRAAAEPALVILGAAGLVVVGRMWRSRTLRVGLASESAPGPRASPRTRRNVLIAAVAVVALVMLTPAVASVGVWPEGAVADRFDRQIPDALGRTETGSRWMLMSGAWGIEDGSARVVRPAPRQSASVVDTGFADGRVGVTIEQIEPGVGLLFRYGDADNHWSVVADPGAGTWTVTKRVDGRLVTVGPVGDLGERTARVEVVRTGVRMVFHVDDRPVGVVVDPELSGATGAGLIAAGGTSQTRPRWNDFEAIPAP